MEFKKFAALIDHQFTSLVRKGALYRVEVDRDTLWNLYLSSFPEGSNPIYIERTEHDCNCCKNFIRDVGNVVYINGDKLETIWDIEIDGPYGIVAKAMSDFVKTRRIEDIFTHHSPNAGAEKSVQYLATGATKNWNHFFCTIPSNYVTKDKSVASNVRTTVEVLERSFNEIKEDAITIVEDLIDQNSLYRGEEFKNVVTLFKKAKKTYSGIPDELKRRMFIWNNINTPFSRIKNSVIGTLLCDLSEGDDIDGAVRSFEAKVAPTNYKRPTALITKGMIDQAMKTINELGLEPALQRRFAVAEDLTINNVLFVDKSTSRLMQGGLLDTLMTEVKVSDKSYSKVEEVAIADFITNVLPNISSIEALVDSRHESNLMSIIAPVNKEAPNILKWNNNFSWSYNGDITDSIKERVKKAGGSLEGCLRTSLSWFNHDDLDIHVFEPTGYEIEFGNKGRLSPNSGMLDVDMNVTATTREPVENIVWKSPERMAKGWYKVYVNNFNKRETADVGFVIQVEFQGTIKNLSYKKGLGQKAAVPVVDLFWNGETVSEVKIHKDVEESTMSKEIWGVTTNQFNKVNLLTISPNHWDGQTIGNKHYFFILEKCLNPNATRGLYNEFLNGSLDTHRKVFETIGNKLRCEPTEKQLSGLGFSSTKKDSLVCKVSGNFNRTLKITF